MTVVASLPELRQLCGRLRELARELRRRQEVPQSPDGEPAFCVGFALHVAASAATAAAAAAMARVSDDRNMAGMLALPPLPARAARAADDWAAEQGVVRATQRRRRRGQLQADTLLGVGLSWQQGEAAYIPLLDASSGSSFRADWASELAVLLTATAVCRPSGDGGSSSSSGHFCATVGLKQQVACLRQLLACAPSSAAAAGAAELPRRIVDARIALWMADPDKRKVYTDGAGQLSPLRLLQVVSHAARRQGRLAAEAAACADMCLPPELAAGAAPGTPDLLHEPAEALAACQAAVAARCLLLSALPCLTGCASAVEGITPEVPSSGGSPSQGVTPPPPCRLLDALLGQEMPLVPVLANMEAAGMNVRPHVIRELVQQLEKRMSQLQTEADRLVAKAARARRGELGRRWERRSLAMGNTWECSEVLFGLLGMESLPSNEPSKRPAGDRKRGRTWRPPRKRCWRSWRGSTSSCRCSWSIASWRTPGRRPAPTWATRRQQSARRRRRPGRRAPPGLRSVAMPAPASTAASFRPPPSRVESPWTSPTCSACPAPTTSQSASRPARRRGPCPPAASAAWLPTCAPRLLLPLAASSCRETIGRRSCASWRTSAGMSACARCCETTPLTCSGCWQPSGSMWLTPSGWSM